MERNKQKRPNAPRHIDKEGNKTHGQETVQTKNKLTEQDKEETRQGRETKTERNQTHGEATEQTKTLNGTKYGQ
jgi:hypothetical protein